MDNILFARLGIFMDFVARLLLSPLLGLLIPEEVIDRLERKTEEWLVRPGAGLDVLYALLTGTVRPDAFPLTLFLAWLASIGFAVKYLPQVMEWAERIIPTWQSPGRGLALELLAWAVWTTLMTWIVCFVGCNYFVFAVVLGRLCWVGILRLLGTLAIRLVLYLLGGEKEMLRILVAVGLVLFLVGDALQFIATF